MDPPIIEITDMDLSSDQTEQIINLLKTDEKYKNIKSYLEKSEMIKDSYTDSNESLFLKIFVSANPKLTDSQIEFYNKKKNDGQITLKVQSGFGPEIQMAIPFLLNQINARFGYKAISKIKILQADIGFINKEEKVTNKNILENSKTFLSDELHDNELRLVMRKFELSRKILPS